MTDENFEEDVSLEGRVIRDKIAEVGMVGGFIGGIISEMVFNVPTEGFKVASMMYSIGTGTNLGLLGGYGIGSIVRPIYEVVKKKYKIVKRDPYE